MIRFGVFGAMILVVVSISAAISAQAVVDIPADTEIVTLPSGLKYSVLRRSISKESPKYGDRVKVDYAAWLTDGEQWASSWELGVPSVFNLGQVIEGWNEGLQLMTIGSRFKFHVPAKLGYGDRRKGVKVEPNSDLIFVVDLLEIRPAPAIPKAPSVTEDKFVKTESGLRYAWLKKPQGPTLGEHDGVLLKYAIWNADGKIIEWTELNWVRPRFETPKTAGLPFLKEILPKMSAGSKVWCDVPPELAFGENQYRSRCPANTRTRWSIEIGTHVPYAAPTGDNVKEKKTESGLRYHVVKEGTGRAIKIDDLVEVDYVGWLPNGSVFDASHRHGAAAFRQVKGNIVGWVEAMQLMKERGVLRVTIPAELAYGEQGYGAIPPRADLVFHLTVHRIMNR